jgi:thiamine biosynthesis protein ThiS
MIDVTINGKAVELTKSVSISEFLASKNLVAQMVVVEHNCEIIPREQFDEITIAPGDSLEIVQMMAGGV